MEQQAEYHEALVGKCEPSQALHHAKKAAEFYFQAADTAAPGQHRSRLRSKCRDMLNVAEALKSKSEVSVKAASAAASPTNLSTSRQLTAREKAILTLASGLHGNKFTPWSTEPLDSEFQVTSDGSLFEDTADFSLSASQAAVTVGWKRPNEILNQKLTSEALHTVDMVVNEEVDLAQDIMTDCSVVASLCSALRNMTSESKDCILENMIYPFDKKARVPKVSNNGKYIFRFYFNGCWRKVVIDDRLPLTTGDRALFVVDLFHPNSLWPALIEKAYLKVRGGYDFPGSNSCTDLWIMTGWIPEQIFLQKEDLDINQIWETISLGFQTKTAIMTLGTGRMSLSEEQVVGIVSEHDYGIVDMKTTDGVRKLQVKNPWCVGPTWAHINNIDVDDTAEPYVGPRSFWVSLEDLAQSFESMYINWNPQLFKHRQDHHFTWNVSKDTSTSDTVFSNPQYQISCTEKTSAWIVLDRHHRDEEVQLTRDRAEPRNGANLGYMSLAIVEDGCKVWKLPSVGSNGDFIDSHQTLAKVTLLPNRKYTIIPLRDKLPLPLYTFTLSAFTMSPVTIQPAPDKRKFVYRQESSWGRRTAGGNSSFPSYGLSPQFQFTLTQATDMSFLLVSTTTSIPIHIDIVWTTPGKRAQFPLPRKVVVADTKEYTRGSVSINDIHLDAGTYAIVCSTFLPNQYAPFSLLVGSDSEIALQTLPVANAGKLPESLPLLRFPEGVSTMRISVSSQRLAHTTVMMQVAPEGKNQHGTPSTVNSSFRISVCYGWGSSQNIVAVSGDGDFEEPAFGLHTPEFDLEPTRIANEGMWLTVERIGGRSSCEIMQVQMFSDRVVSVGEWEERD